MTPLLHIYAQFFEHQEAYILGNETALLALRDALNQILSGQKDVTTAECFTNDGEGYLTFVKLCKESELNEANLPYTDFYERHGIEPQNKTPYEIVGPEEYQAGHARLDARYAPKRGV